LPAGGVFRVVQYLPPAGREMISLHPRCAALAGGKEKAPARRAVFALPNYVMTCRTYINRPMSWSIKHRCTEGSLRPNVCRSRTPEAVGLTGAGRAQRGMQGESFPLPAGGVIMVIQYLPPAGREMISLHPRCATLAGGREMVPAQRIVFALPNYVMACRIPSITR
jgi:hypothetical protein